MCLLLCIVLLTVRMGDQVCCVSESVLCEMVNMFLW